MTVPGLFKKDRKQKAKQTKKDTRESSENKRTPEKAHDPSGKMGRMKFGQQIQ